MSCYTCNNNINCESFKIFGNARYDGCWRYVPAKVTETDKAILIAESNGLKVSINSYLNNSYCVIVRRDMKENHDILHVLDNPPKNICVSFVPKENISNENNKDKVISNVIKKLCEELLCN